MLPVTFESCRRDGIKMDKKCTGVKRQKAVPFFFFKKKKMLRFLMTFYI